MIVKLDASEIFPGDPGNGTPAMVYLPFGRGCSTYWCACGEGDIEGVELTPEQYEWLESLDVAITQWLDGISRAMESSSRNDVLAALD